MKSNVRRLLTALVLVAICRNPAKADEGMWLLNQPPRDLLKKKYDFDLTDAWLQRAMKASIRFTNGASGSFVSRDGLVLTNHHVGADSIQKLSTKEKNLLKNGFYAKTPAEEFKCPDLELNVLQAIDDVTTKVQGAVKAEMTPAQAAAARRAVIARLEKDASKIPGQRSEVTVLYQGGQYHLYRYQKYTDVRLVFAPENAIGQFGGDVDNFEYPRHGFDVCFFRVWDNGKPLKSEHFFKWSKQGPAEGDLVFVVGHPGSTNRLESYERLRHRRDFTLPYTLARLRYLEALLEQFAATGPEAERVSKGELYAVANARKAITGQYQGLLDPAIVARKKLDEQNFIMKLADKQTDVVAALQNIAAAQKALGGFEREYQLVEIGDAFNSRLFRIARHILRMGDEVLKKDGDRLREYRDSALESLKIQVFSPAPLSLELEGVKLAGSLTFLAEQLGGEHPLVVKALAGKSPAARASELVNGTTLADPAARLGLVGAGKVAIDASSDPMLVFARSLDDDARKLHKRYEEEVAEVDQQAYATISKARFELYGSAVPPDATFTLRLAFGVVKGYTVDGVDLPFHTTFGSAFQRAKQMANKAPFDMPKRWLDARAKVDPLTPFNFAATSDTIGGNSGSPVLNRAGEFVGINFDRNRHGLVRNYVYTEEQARHIAVDAQGILAALRVIYDADPLATEVTAESRNPPEGPARLKGAIQ
jgi:hypothetical protein